MERLRRTFSSLRLRVPAIAMAVFAISLTVSSILAYELLLRDSKADIDTVIAREQERFERSMGELLVEASADDPQAEPIDALRAAVRRYLALNPSTESYWTIVTFSDGRRLAAANGPPELEPFYHEDRLPSGQPNVIETVSMETGDIRTSSVPVRLGGEELATLQIVSPLGPERQEALQAAQLVALSSGIALLLGGVLLAASLWRSLTPLGQLAAAARSTELRSLGSRVEVPDNNDEVGILAREFNTMLTRLERASDAQREFMASVGHELRTPITIARGHLELLATLDEHDPAAVQETAGILRDELGRMGRLVEDLMAIARSDMDNFIRPRDIEMVQWFEDLELKLTGLSETDRVHIAPPPPIMLHADPDRLSQAVLNLISNAQVHTPDGTTIRVSARVADEQVVIAVTDDGPGIPEEIREQVFRPFVRAGETPTSTGLGLSVVAAVARAHGGGTRLHTGAHGTRIELRIPHLAGAADEPDPADDDVDDPQGGGDRDTLELEVTDDQRPTARLFRTR